MNNNIKKCTQIVLIKTRNRGLVETLIVFDRISSFLWRYATRLGVAGSADQLPKLKSPINSESLVEGLLIARTLSLYRNLCYSNELMLLH